MQSLCETQLVPRWEERPQCCAAAKDRLGCYAVHYVMPFPACSRAQHISQHKGDGGKWGQIPSTASQMLQLISFLQLSSSPQLMTPFSPPQRADFHEAQLYLHVAMDQDWPWDNSVLYAHTTTPLADFSAVHRRQRNLKGLFTLKYASWVGSTGIIQYQHTYLRNNTQRGSAAGFPLTRRFCCTLL